MSLQDDAIRSVVRAAGWQVMRRAPLWVSLLVLLLALIFGGHH